MNPSERLLHREGIIRLAGVMMLLSPFANVLLSVAAIDNLPNKWNHVIILQVMTSVPWIQWVLRLASFAVGFMMIKGRRASWTSVLVILLFFIVYGILNFKESSKTGVVITLLALATNVAFFALVYYQEYWQVQQSLIASQKTLKAAGKTTEVSSHKAKETMNQIETEEASENFAEIEQDSPSLAEIVPKLVAKIPSASRYDLSALIGYEIEFEELGTWAVITKATDHEIHLRRLMPAPEGLEQQAVEISLDESTSLQFRLSKHHKKESIFTFEKVNHLAPQQEAQQKVA